MTVLVRSDLTDGYKVVQTAHAIADFAVEHKDVFKSWQAGSNYLCCLEVNDLTELLAYEDKLRDLGLKYTYFYEPDIDEVTSLAIEPVHRDLHRKMYSRLNLTT